jgi:MFS family permease
MTDLPERPGPFSALAYRDFRLLWAGQVLSLVGTRMQAGALLWQLYAVTGSPAAIGLIGLARVVPLLVFALVGGVVADSLDRRRLMIVSQTVMAILAAGLGLWSLRGLSEAWPIYAVAALNAAATAFDSPARQSMLPALVPRAQLANAVSLNSMTSQLASIAGPALMGLVIAHTGVGVVYCLNAASFLAVIAALLAMRQGGGKEGRPPISLEAALEGLRFVRGSRLLLSLMLLDALATFFASATALLPVFAKDILRVGAAGYGWLTAAPPVGSALAALAMSLLPPPRHQGRVVLAAVFAYGIATVFFGLSRAFLPCLLALAGTGAADTVSTVLRQTIRQLHTPDALRGRMTSVNMVFFMGGPQLGELEAGLVANWFGAPVSVISGGVACMLAVLGIGAASPRLRDYDRGSASEG